MGKQVEKNVDTKRILIYTTHMNCKRHKNNAYFKEFLTRTK